MRITNQKTHCTRVNPNPILTATYPAGLPPLEINRAIQEYLLVHLDATPEVAEYNAEDLIRVACLRRGEDRKPVAKSEILGHSVWLDLLDTEADAIIEELNK